MAEQVPDNYAQLRGAYLVAQRSAADATLAVEEARRAVLYAIVETAHIAQDERVQGMEFVRPTGAHDSYAKGDVVTRGNKTWVSLMDFNVHIPGVTGWREQVAEGYPQWKQPLGAHDAYNIPDRVSFGGNNYETEIDANTWAPLVHGWKQI